MAVEEQRTDLRQDSQVLNPLVQVGTGGLNLSESALTVPLTDSMVARNIVVGEDGVLRRRPGTQYINGIFSRTGPALGRLSTSTCTVTTPRGHDFIFARWGRSVSIRRVEQSKVSNVISSSTWAPTLLADGATEDGSFFVLKDPRIRVLFFHPTLPTTEIRLNEVRVTGISGGRTITISKDIRGHIPGVYGGGASDKGSFNLIINGTTVNIDSVTETATTFTLNYVITQPELKPQWLVDIQYFSAYHWAESEMYYADRFTDTVIRTNLTDKDVHVAVPSNLRDGIERRGTTRHAAYTLDAIYWDTTDYKKYTQNTTGLPVGPTTFSMSDGTARINNSPIIPSPLFMTFGEWVSGKVQPVIINRHRRLNLNGGVGVAGADLKVYVGDTEFSHTASTSGAGALNTYRLHDETDSTQVTSAVSKTGKYLSLDGAWKSTPQLDPSSVVRIVHTYNERSATNSSPVPCYGMGAIADYNIHSYPSCGTTFQDRMVVAGMPHDPLLVAFSAVYDSRTPEEPFMYFQNDPLDLVPETSAFQVRVESDADDRIVAMHEFQGSLFVFTYRAVFRIAATGRSVISPSNYFVSNVSGVGVTGPGAITRPDGGIAFLSTRGVFAITNGTQSNESTEYKLVELSEKIAPLFDPKINERGPSRIWWLSYAADERRLYMGLSTTNDKEHCSLLYTYDVTNSAWSEMDTVGGFRTFHGFDVKLNYDKSQHYIFCDPFISGAFDLIATGRPVHLDYATFKPRGVVGSAVIDKIYPKAATTFIPLIKGMGDIDGPIGSIYRLTTKHSPLTGVPDIRVRLNNTPGYFEPGTDYIKRSGNYIQLLNPVGGTATTMTQELTLIGSDGQPSLTNVGAVIEGLSGVDTPDMWVEDFEDVTYNKRSIAFTIPNEYAVWVGTLYQSVWVSPVYTLGSIIQDKDVNAVSLYIERERNKSHWFGTDHTYDENYWPQVELNPLAGKSFAVTDTTIEFQNGFVGLITDQEDTQTHPLTLADEQDFLDNSTPSNPVPPNIQSPDGNSIRRSFSDVNTVFQVCAVSIGTYPMGISAVQMEATQQRSHTVSKTR